MLSSEERYQFKPFVGSSHTWALELCKNLDPSISILDVGSGSGNIGHSLKQLGFSKLYAVESDPVALAEARKVYLQAHSSLEPFREQKFDLILLLDVLEHTTNPSEFFGQIINLATQGSTILVSVPNIAHWSVRLPLLFGFFEYTNRGIIDRTHFSFFTRRRLRQFFKEHPEVEVINISSSIEPVELVLPKMLWDNKVFKFISDLRSKFANLLPGLMAYQHLSLLKVNK